MEGLGINLKFLIAQLVNFTILFLIIKKFLYRPIKKVLDKRSAEVEDALRNNEKIKEELAAIEKTKAEEIEKVKNQSAEILEKARQGAQELTADLKKEAEEKAEKLIEKAKLDIEAEKEKSLNSLRGEIAGLVEASLVKILNNQINEKEQKELVKESVKEIQL